MSLYQMASGQCNGESVSTKTLNVSDVRISMRKYCQRRRNIDTCKHPQILYFPT